MLRIALGLVLVMLGVQFSLSRPEISEKPPVVPTNRSMQSMPVIYPDSFHNMTAGHLLTKREYMPPRNACNETFCEAVDDYPEDYINGLLKKTKVFEKYFRASVAIGNRIGSGTMDKGEQTLCGSEHKFVAPQMGMDKENKYKYIVNTKEYTQLVLSHKCLGEGSQCLYSEFFPLSAGQEAVCSQKFYTARMVALGSDGVPAVDEILMPSCCVCTIRSKKAMP